MEFASELEAVECLGRAAYGYNGSYGFVDKHETAQPSTVEKPVTNKQYKYLVGAYLGGSTLYVKERGTTYHFVQAKEFTKEQADKKASAMTRNGKSGYRWVTIRKS